MPRLLKGIFSEILENSDSFFFHTIPLFFDFVNGCDYGLLGSFGITLTCSPFISCHLPSHILRPDLLFVLVHNAVIDPAARFMVTASSNRGWSGESTRVVLIQDIKHVV